MCKGERQKGNKGRGSRVTAQQAGILFYEGWQHLSGTFFASPVGDFATVQQSVDAYKAIRPDRGAEDA